MRAFAADIVACQSVYLSVCLSVSLLVTFMSPTKCLNLWRCHLGRGGLTQVGRMNRVLARVQGWTNAFAAAKGARCWCSLSSKSFDYLFACAIREGGVMWCLAFCNCCWVSSFSFCSCETWRSCLAGSVSVSSTSSAASLAALAVLYLFLIMWRWAAICQSFCYASENSKHWIVCTFGSCSLIKS